MAQVVDTQTHERQILVQGSQLHVMCYVWNLSLMHYVSLKAIYMIPWHGNVFTLLALWEGNPPVTRRLFAHMAIFRGLGVLWLSRTICWTNSWVVGDLRYHDTNVTSGKGQYKWSRKKLGQHTTCSTIRFIDPITRIMTGIEYTGLILGLRPANERRRYKVTPSLIGWAQTYNRPWIYMGFPTPSGADGSITKFGVSGNSCELKTGKPYNLERGKIILFSATMLDNAILSAYVKYIFNTWMGFVISTLHAGVPSRG